MRDHPSETLTEEGLDRLLAGLRNPSSYLLAVPPQVQGACLSLAQARLLVLDPSQLGEEERTHSERCARCARLCEQMARSMPHLPWKVLLLAELGYLPPAARRGMEYHLLEGCCARCIRRAQAIHAARERQAACFRLTPLPHPQALVAGSARLSLVASSADELLEAELCEEDSGLVLEVRSRDPRLDGHLIGYLFYGRGRSCVVEGFTVLHPDVEGWYTGHAVFTKEEFYAHLQGCCEGLVVSPVDASLLGPPEWESLEASTRRLPDAASRSAWIRWLEHAETQAVPDPLPLATLRAHLAPSGPASPSAQ